MKDRAIPGTSLTVWTAHLGIDYSKPVELDFVTADMPLHAAGLQTNDDGGVPDNQICAAGWPPDVLTHPPDTIPCAHHPDRE